MTSRQAADCVKKLVVPSKVGHTGTLDPLASGVLVMCLGPATRLAEFVQQARKTYVGEFRFGFTSASDDIETELVPVGDSVVLTQAELEAVLTEFMGKVEQRPPAYSAIKLDGKRAYALARKGISVEIKPRIVSIDSIELLEFNYPDFKLRIKCGAGTYIRALGRDIGKRLNSGAVMTGLTRTAVGQFVIDDAVNPEQLAVATFPQHVVAPGDLFGDCPQVVFDDTQIELLKNGHLFSAAELSIQPSPEPVAAFDRDRRLIAVMYPHGVGQLRPRINFVHHYDE